MRLDGLVGVAEEAMDLAVGIFASHGAGELALTKKGDRDYASALDYQIENRVRDLLATRTPNIGFVGEETATGRSAELTWTLDPIDGTVNFVHGLPLCGISLALVQDDQPILGIIELPALRCRYSAVAGRGAYRDGLRLRTATTTRLANALVTIGDYAVGDHAESKNHQRLLLTTLLAGRALRIRMLGSAAIDLAWLAEGKTDASITLSNRSWDVAAGVIIAREAGAAVFDLDRSDHSTRSSATIATTSGLAPELQGLLDQLTATSHPLTSSPAR